MKPNFRLYSFTVITVLIALSCSDDSDSFQPSASDITITIDENPTNGESLGVVATNLTGTLVYSITSQNPSDAFSINSTSGEIIINDTSKFNYEINSSLEATISVTNSEQSATSSLIVILNDIDDIWYFLSSSRETYLNAQDDSWIMVTANEYDMLAENLLDTTRSGTSEDEYNSTGYFTSGGGNTTWNNDNDKTIPPGSYLVAFKVYSWSNNTASSSVKISTDESTGPYMSFGENLPQHNSGNHYFVFKGSDSPIQSEAHLGYFASAAIGAKALSGSVFRVSSGNAETLFDVNGGYVILFQGLSTTVKQWD
jgi:hypothetical protein